MRVGLRLLINQQARAPIRSASRTAPALAITLAEICELPRRHRVALLLNLKSPRGLQRNPAVPATEIATFEQIAEALEIPQAEFEQMWRICHSTICELPLISALRGSRLINLRKTARDRLLRFVRFDKK